jgi:type 1 fimbriae regulatory protein FimB
MPAQSNIRREKPDRKRSYLRDDIQYFNEEELVRFFAAIESRGNIMHRAMFHVVLNRGLRASEVGLLQFAHLRLTARTLFVPRLKNGISGEHPLTDPEVRALRAWIAIRGAGAGPIFPSRHNRPISRRRLDQLVKTYCAAATIPAPKRHMHSLRHTAGTLRGEMGDLIEVQDLLGHRDPRSTLVYMRLRDKRRALVGERWRSGLLPR